MKRFLQHIANELIQSGEYHRKIVVLPNKRSGVFLKKALIEAEQKVILSPEIISIREFINRLSAYRPIESLTLLFEFFQVYKQTYKDQAQSFEDFIKWAQPILSDFDDIDAFDVNAKEIFTYIHEVKKLEDWQLKPESPKLISDYLQFYASLHDLYRHLQKRLQDKKLAYDGMQSRWVAGHMESLLDNFQDEQIIFAGFNALTKTEETIIRTLILNRKAKIYWDADKYYMKPGFEAGKFMLQNQKNFKDFKWIFNDFAQSKQIEIIAVPGKNTQAQVVAQQISDILSNKSQNTGNLLDTAVVLNENDLLLPLINSLPDDIKSVNITLGLSLEQLPVVDLFLQVSKLYYEREQYGRFNVDTLTGLIHQTYWEQIISNDEQLANQKLLEFLLQFKTKLISEKLWLSAVQSTDSFLKIFFSKGYNVNNLLLIFFELIDYLSDKNLSALDRLALVKLEKILQDLQTFIRQSGEIKTIRTFQFLLKQAIRQERLAFEGEPLEGLQIMGLLETRLLDFKQVIITSVNEGILPKSNTERSIIPFELKKHFGLPMHNEKTAITAYHFYRLLQRAEKITLLYNTDTTGFGAAEQSRFITQLENELNPKKHQISKKQLDLPAEIFPEEKQEIQKNDFVMQRLEAIAESGFSASSMLTYIRNPLIFYKRYILKLEEEDQVDDAIAANVMGNIIHHVMENLYRKYTGKIMQASDFDDMLKSYESLCLQAFIHESFGKHTPVQSELIEGKNLIVFEIIKKNVKEMILMDKKTVKEHKKLEIVAVEQKLKVPLQINGKTVYIKGFIDRIDRLDGVLRIIDYKTGKVDNKKFNIKDWDILVEKDGYDKAFQVLTYAWMYDKSDKSGSDDFPLQAGIISTRQIQQKVQILKILNSKLIDKNTLQEFEHVLRRLIEEIFNPDIPFIETDSSY